MSLYSNTGFQHTPQILQSGPLFLREQGRLGQPRPSGTSVEIVMANAMSGCAEMGLLGLRAGWGRPQGNLVKGSGAY